MENFGPFQNHIMLCFLPKHLCFHVFHAKKTFTLCVNVNSFPNSGWFINKVFFYNTTSPNVYKLYSKSFSQISLRIIFDCWKKYFQKSFQNKQKRIAQNFSHCWSILLELWVSWFHSAFVPLFLYCCCKTGLGLVSFVHCLCRVKIFLS